VLLLVDAGATFKELGKRSDRQTGGLNATERIRLYLTRHVRTPIKGQELEVVSGISEYARRVRELRVEEGFRILTGHSNDEEMGIELGPSEYYLVRTDPDHTAARRWQIANRIRRTAEWGSQRKLLEFLKRSVGEVVTTEELAYVSNNARQYARRTRELRTEHGYLIATRFTGRPDLRVGEYVMESAERVAEPHDRNIPFETQKTVYERDRNTCIICGWTHEQWRREDPRILELHHVREHVDGGTNTADNLLVICSRCHDDVHAGRRNIPENLS
jgi:hypothetical protein